MRALRWAAAALTVLFALYSLRTLVLQPYRCNIVALQAQTSAEVLLKAPASFRTVLEARDTAHRLQGCIESCPTDVDLYMTLAVYDRLLGRLDDAAEIYREAIKYDQRPELYFNLGLVELESNRRTDAVAAFVKACSFDFKYSLEIPDESVVSEVVAAVLRQRKAAQRAAGR